MQSNATESYWASDVDELAFPVARSCDVDVAIVGAGIAGITTAFLLAESGKTVALIDMGPIARGQTANTTAHLTWVVDQPLSRLAHDFGKRASFVLEAHQSAINEIERIVRRLGIECAFERVSAWRFGLEARDRRQLERDARIARELGRDAHYIGPGTLRVPSPGGAMHAPDQGKFHPLEFVQALAQHLATNGANIFAHSTVTETVRVDGRWEVRVPSHDATIRAHDVIVTTNSPLGLVPALQTRLEPYQSYALAAQVTHGTLPVGLYWDCEEPYQYIRVEAGEAHDTLIVGGMDHKTGEKRDTRECHESLLRYLRERLGIVPDAVTHRWSGQVLEAADGVAYIGKFPGSEPRHWVATGFGGNGMTYSVASAMLLRDLVLERENAWSEVFDPSRVKPLASARDFVRANVDVALRMVGGRLSPAECESIDEVPRGEGRTVLVQGKKLAVYRDDRGQVTALSPVCPHMGCIVDWNAQEKTWDCPCHGSRFHAQGGVQSGPATAGLERVEVGEGAGVKEPV
jgi:glycine/D-amino acid oxidase-like deaminating enzyme/nitrite reductase/ring-hydroxylating ferredoxin subunit